MLRWVISFKMFARFFFIFLQVQTCLLQTNNWKSLKRSAEPQHSTGTNATASLIFLHGLGDTSDVWHTTFSDIIGEHVRLVRPKAGIMPVTVNNGTRMAAWFDIKGLNSANLEDVAGIQNASQRIHQVIRLEMSKGMAADRIMLIGFSQGGALALYSALTFPHRLAGVVGMSCWMPLQTVFSPSSVTANRNLPVLLCHGNRDPIVPYTFAQISSFLIRIVSTNVQFKTYPELQHFISATEMEDVKNFINTYLPEQI